METKVTNQKEPSEPGDPGTAEFHEQIFSHHPEPLENQLEPHLSLGFCTPGVLQRGDVLHQRSDFVQRPDFVSLAGRPTKRARHGHRGLFLYVVERVTRLL